MLFQTFLESKTTIVSVSLGHYPEQLKNYLDKLSDYSARETERINRFVFDLNRLKQLLQQVGYPQIDRILMAVAGKNPMRLRIVTQRYTTWMNSQPYDWKQPDRNYQDYMRDQEPKREIRNILYDYYSQLFRQDGYTEEQANKQYQILINQTTEEIKKIAENIQKSIDSIPDWNGSPVRVIANDSTDNYLEPMNSAEVVVGDKPSFTYFSNPPKYEIDDVLDSGDDDFFTNPKIEADYFRLVQELKNPGIANKGKILTLFTARPVKDRALYEKARQDLAMGVQAVIPSKIFLTSNPDSAEGIAMDLAGSGRRDVWKIKIDSRYLIQTLEGRERQYQVIGDDFVPIKWIDFYMAGEA